MIKFSLNNCFDDIYSYVSKIYFSSYTSYRFKSIYDYYSYLLLLDTSNKSLLRCLPQNDKFRYMIWTFMNIYYLTLCTGWIKYSDSFRFITNDPSVLIDDNNGEQIKHITLLLITYYFTALYLYTYDSFRTHSSLAMRTFIIYVREFCTEYSDRMLETIGHKYQYYSRTTCLLLNYTHKNTQPNYLEFKKFFDHVHHIVCISNVLLNICFQLFKLDKFIHTRPIWQIIIRSMSLQFFMVVMNFMISTMYTLAMVTTFSLRIEAKVVKNVKFEIDKILDSIETILNNRKNEPIHLDLMKMKLKRLYKIYIRLIVFVEQVQPYVAQMTVWGIFVNIIGSQIVINCLKRIENDEYFLLILLFYALIAELSIIIFLTYVMSKFNLYLNSIRLNLQRTTCLAMKTDDIYFKFHMTNYYERIVSRKQWGLRIGPITVLTRLVFLKLMIFYVRFTVLSSKLFKN
ncbi:hypothetical protein DERP_001763 [Dermatophagoides pteronyssinus]|uniref:Odorant receptor n=1 Tax=Dermatophagoides pteronyssinus TaxID=6956 RepID=A0ABQ8JBE9_DERPT|nr:hypothetical protein DERP_001763 [Dermatophagoides pteronyssinus]